MSTATTKATEHWDAVVTYDDLDSLDAKLHAFQQLMDEDPNVESPWTLYHASLGRKLFKGYRSAAAPS